MSRSYLFIWFMGWVTLSAVSCGGFSQSIRNDQEISSGELDLMHDPAADQGFHLEESSRRSVASSSLSESGRESSESLREDGSRFSSQDTPELIPETRRSYHGAPRVSREDFVDHSQEEGSLWASSGQTNYYFTKNKVRSPGDLVSIVIEQDLYKIINSEIKRNLISQEKQMEIEFLRNQYLSGELSQVNMGSSGIDKSGQIQRQDLNNGQNLKNSISNKNGEKETETEKDRLSKKINNLTINDVDIQSSLELKSGDTMMGEISDRYANGSYKVRVSKKIPYKYGPPRTVNLVGIVKGSDIGEENDSVTSGKLYDYRLEVAR